MAKGLKGEMNSDTARKTFFAVTSLGKGRWYWVVWPSLEMVRSGESGAHVAEGYERAKTEAVDRALEVAGMHGEWVAAKYAKAYHRRHSQKRRSPEALAFLYRDVRDESTGEWRSEPHRVAKRTHKYVYVEQRPYEPERLTGSWPDRGVPTFRLDRAMLEEKGYAFVPVTADVDDPLFFTMPYRERVVQYGGLLPACFSLLGLSFPCTVAEVRAAYRDLAKRAHPDRGGSHGEFLELRAAYEQALHLCRYTS
jgi:hypothetical protein